MNISFIILEGRYFSSEGLLLGMSRIRPENFILCLAFGCREIGLAGSSGGAGIIICAILLDLCTLSILCRLHHRFGESDRLENSLWGGLCSSRVFLSRELLLLSWHNLSFRTVFEVRLSPLAWERQIYEKHTGSRIFGSQVYLQY